MTQSNRKPADLGWMVEAACRGSNADVFFPSADGDDAPAKVMCAECPVRLACLSFALERSEKFGVWGGLNEKERARLTEDERERVRREAARAA